MASWSNDWIPRQAEKLREKFRHPPDLTAVGAARHRAAFADPEVWAERYPHLHDLLLDDRTGAADWLAAGLLRPHTSAILAAASRHVLQVHRQVMAENPNLTPSLALQALAMEVSCTAVDAGLLRFVADHRDQLDTMVCPLPTEQER